MFWTKNKEGKKTGTTLIGISWDGDAAIGTDFNEAKADGNQISRIEQVGNILIGFTGPTNHIEGFDIAKSAIESGANIEDTAGKIADLWKTNKDVNAFLAFLDGERSFVAVPGKAEVQKAGLVALGPGEEYALAAIRAILAQPVVQESAFEMVKKAFNVASGVCVLVNSDATIVKLEKQRV
ncbi:hypothetical protein KAH81_01100 [bacterium]|nr:hypothetical protein [bacterium]